MVYLTPDCDCKTCNGGTPAPKGVFGGSMCLCSCHYTDQEPQILSRATFPPQAQLTRTSKALSLALKTIEDLQGHKVTKRDVQELMDNVNKIERG